MFEDSQSELDALRIAEGLRVRSAFMQRFADTITLVPTSVMQADPEGDLTADDAMMLDMMRHFIRDIQALFSRHVEGIVANRLIEGDESVPLFNPETDLPHIHAQMTIEVNQRYADAHDRHFMHLALGALVHSLRNSTVDDLVGFAEYADARREIDAAYSVIAAHPNLTIEQLMATDDGYIEYLRKVSSPEKWDEKMKNALGLAKLSPEELGLDESSSAEDKARVARMAEHIVTTVRDWRARIWPDAE